MQAVKTSGGKPVKSSPLKPAAAAARRSEEPSLLDLHGCESPKIHGCHLKLSLLAYLPISLFPIAGDSVATTSTPNNTTLNSDPISTATAADLLQPLTNQMAALSTSPSSSVSTPPIKPSSQEVYFTVVYSSLHFFTFFVILLL